MNKILQITTLLISSLLLLSSNFASSQEQDQAGVSSLPEISASFTVDVIPADQVNNTNFSENILVWRHNNLLEIHHTDSSFGEYWNLFKNGRVLYRWIHHNRKFIVNHEPTLYITPEAGLLSWESKATFFNRKFLSELTKTGESDFQGYPSEQYEGNLDGEAISVNWLPTLSLPASIVQATAGDIYSITLKEIYPLESSPLISIKTDSYRDIDYVDFEDEQTDPDVQFYMQVLDEGGHIH